MKTSRRVMLARSLFVCHRLEVIDLGVKECVIE
jgi:hypothetical protein